MYSSFAQIKKITILLILSQVLPVCNFKTLRRWDTLFYPLIFYGITLLCKLPNRLDRLFYPLTTDGLFTYYASYQIGQIYLASGTRCLACSAKHQIDQMILDGFLATSNGLGSNHRYGLHTIKICPMFIAKVWVVTIDMDCTLSRSGQCLIYTPRWFNLQVLQQLLFQDDWKAKFCRYNDKVDTYNMM